MTPAALKLHSALVAVGLSIVGVAIGKRNDKSTWRIDWSGAPEKAQTDLAAQVVAALDLGAPDQAEIDVARRNALLYKSSAGLTDAEKDEALKLLLAG